MRKTGFTLLEMLLAVAIVAVLVAILAVSASSLRREARIRLTESTIGILMTALEQYHEFWGDYPPGVPVPAPIPGAAGEWSRGVLENAFGAVSNASWTSVLNAGHKDENAPSEALYIRLYRTPVTKRMIDKMTSGPKIPGKPQGRVGRMLVFDPDPSPKAPFSAADYPNIPASLIGTGTPAEQISLYRFVDAWENPLRYEYRKDGMTIPGSIPPATYTTTDQFPIIRSAGPDGVFGTNDDIKSNRI